jgi:hypothetical protein
MDHNMATAVTARRSRTAWAGLKPFADPEYGNSGPREEQQD